MCPLVILKDKVKSVLIAQGIEKLKYQRHRRSLKSSLWKATTSLAPKGKCFSPPRKTLCPPYTLQRKGHWKAPHLQIPSSLLRSWVLPWKCALCVNTHMHHNAHMGIKGQLQELELPFHPRKRVYPRSHQWGPHLFFLHIYIYECFACMREKGIRTPITGAIGD